MKQGGTIANKNGSNLESFVETALTNCGYEFIDSKKFLPFSKVAEQPIYSKQVNIGESIYKKVRRCDFILFHPTKYPNKNLVIECKWQDSAGSVHEKYPFLEANSLSILDKEKSILYISRRYILCLLKIKLFIIMMLI